MSWTPPDFVDREEELAFFGRAFSRKSAELLILFGRRRVGKTALLQQFVQKSAMPILYHVAVQTTVKEELARFSSRLSDFFKDPLPTLHPFETWPGVLEYLGQRAREKPFGWVLDEMPYAVEGERSLPSLLQAAWDGALRRTGIKIVLCGSSIGMMEEIGILPTSPLFGRRTGQWKLEPLNPEALAELWPAKNLADALEVYGILGGCPLYATKFDPGLAVLDNIRDRILTKGEFLYDEVPFLLREEVRDARVYQAILASIALGARKFSELSSKTGLDRAHLTRYLSILAELGLVRREVPVTETLPHKSRKGLYRIEDPFVAFWYRYSFPHRDLLDMGKSQAVLDETVRPTLDSHLSTVLEPFIGSLFRSRWRRRVPFDPGPMGRYWSDKEELDWVILDRGRTKALVAEIKWTRDPIGGRRVLDDLRQRVLACEALRGLETTHAVIARAGFADRPRARPGEVFLDLRKERIARA